MGRIVAACAASHILMSPTGCEEQAARIVAGMAELGRRLRKTEPDVVVLITSDHMFNINLSLQPRFVVGVADSYLPMGDMDIPRDPVPGSRVVGRAITDQADKDGFDICQAEEYALDHGVMVPLLFMDLRGIPVVPLIVNINTEPMPSASRCLALARSVRRAIEQRTPSDCKVAVIGAGGLSHWLCVPRHGEVSVEFDRMVMEKLASGQMADLVAMGNDAIIEQGGNAGIEILTWVMAAEAASASSGETLYYEPMSQWFTGIGGMEFHVK